MYMYIYIYIHTYIHTQVILEQFETINYLECKQKQNKLGIIISRFNTHTDVITRHHMPTYTLK